MADKEPSGLFTKSKKKYIIGQKYRETYNIAKIEINSLNKYSSSIHCEGVGESNICLAIVNARKLGRVCMDGSKVFFFKC